MVQYREAGEVGAVNTLGPEEVRGGRGYPNTETVSIWERAVNRSHGP